MARRKRVYPAKVYKDPKFDSQVVGRLISKVMKDGKRSLAERIVYAAIDRANEGIDTVDPLEVITRAVENSKPSPASKTVTSPSRRRRPVAVVSKARRFSGWL